MSILDKCIRLLSIRMADACFCQPVRMEPFYSGIYEKPNQTLGYFVPDTGSMAKVTAFEMSNGTLRMPWNSPLALTTALFRNGISKIPIGHYSGSMRMKL